MSRLSPGFNAIKSASTVQVNSLYKAWQNTYYGHEVSPLSPDDQKRLVAETPSLAPLMRIHSDLTITVGNSASYDYWKGKSTEEIIESLKEGSKYGELTVYENGRVANGNTRIKILEERGIDVNKLERVIRQVEEIGPIE